MPKAKALKPLRYLSRMLEVGDEFEVMPADVRWATTLGRAELVADEPTRRGPGRPPQPKAEPESDPTSAVSEAPQPTHADLMARAEELGVELPSGYVTNKALQELIAQAETDRG